MIISVEKLKNSNIAIENVLLEKKNEGIKGIIEVYINTERS